ncbi:MAG: hypothetical protein QF408_08175 [Pirellulales bacterium]|nr:hypothetical protein [Pirellulales bacterium]
MRRISEKQGLAYNSSLVGKSTMHNERLGSLMPQIRHWLLVIVAMGCLQSLATAQVVYPGADLYTVEGESFFDFSINPIPADFFFPGSDSFFDVIEFDPEWNVDPIDVIIERLGPAALLTVGSSDVVPIELVELKLQSVNPITITFGGNVDSFFDMTLELDPTKPPSTGEMKIERTDALGGTYEIPTEMVPLQLVAPVIIFTQVGNPANEKILEMDGLLGRDMCLESIWQGSWEFMPTHDQLIIPSVTGPEFYPVGPLILEGDGLHLELAPATIPAPATGCLLVLGLLSCCFLRRRRCSTH